MLHIFFIVQVYNIHIIFGIHNFHSGIESILKWIQQDFFIIVLIILLYLLIGWVSWS